VSFKHGSGRNRAQNEGIGHKTSKEQRGPYKEVNNPKLIFDIFGGFSPQRGLVDCFFLAEAPPQRGQSPPEVEEGGNQSHLRRIRPSSPAGKERELRTLKTWVAIHGPIIRAGGSLGAIEYFLTYTLPGSI
jgi:hypothetical protein